MKVLYQNLNCKMLASAFDGIISLSTHCSLRLYKDFKTTDA